MSTSQSRQDRGTTGAGGAAGASPAGIGAARAAATGLWVLVGGGLLYGVVQTVIRASQLFT